MAKILSLILISCIFFSVQAVFAYDLSEYKLLSPTIKEITHIDENIKIIKPIIQSIEDKLVKQKKILKASDYNNNINQLNTLKSNFYKLNFAYKAGNPEKAKEFLGKVLVQIKDIQLLIMPSRNVETRGLYIDTDNIPLTKVEIKKLVLEIKNANFNVIYPEVFRRGYSIFKNNVSDMEKPFKDANFDVLEYLIEEAHKNNLDVYPWIWTFRVKSPLYSDYFLKKFPDLVAKRQVNKFEDREPLFLSPAEPKARNLILKILRTLTINYDIDGLLLDYIRYDETLAYDTLTKKYFEEYYQQKYNKSFPNKIIPNSVDFKELQIWREEQVTSMIKKTGLMLKNIKPKIKIGVAIFRTEKEGRLLKMQDWRHWSSNNYVDFVCPMLYTDRVNDLEDWLNSETDKNTRFDYLYPSLGAHRFYTSNDIFPLIGLIHKRHIAGLNVFSLEHIGRENLPDLKKGVFKNKAIISDKNPTKSFVMLINNFRENLKSLNIAKTNINTKTQELENALVNQDFSKANLKIEEIKNSFEYLKDKEIIEFLSADLDYILRLIKIEDRINYSKSNFIKITDPPLVK